MRRIIITLMFVTAYLLAWADNTVNVFYEGTTATVTVDDNVAQYLTITQNGAHVSVVQSSDVTEEITYTLSGTSSDGEFYMSGSFKATIELNGLSLTNTTPVYSGAAVHIQNGKRINVKVITGTTNTLADAASGSQKGCLYVKGHAEFKQQGTLNIVGNVKHGIKAGEYISIKNATINITSAVGDGISCNQYFLMESGSVNISGTGDDGIQCELDGDTSTGMTVNHEDEDSGNVYVSGGSISINCPAVAAKGINSVGDIYISDNAIINITTTGNGMWDETDLEAKAACGMSADGNIDISGGTITLTATGSGGKGMKCDNVMTISGGDITVATSGGLYYNNGTNENLNYTGNTEQINNNYYTSPKGVKAGTKSTSGYSTTYSGGIDISGGTLSVSTIGNNAEGIESKNYLNITGGEITVDAHDDGINSAQDLTITDGYVYSRGSNNDGIDANGDVFIQGGLIYAIGASTPEVAIDANSEENKKFYFTGGTLIAIGGLERGSSLSQTCYQASSWNSNRWYSLTFGGTVIAFKTPASGGNPLVVSAESTPTVMSGVSINSGTSIFEGRCYLDAAVSGGSNVTLSQYSSGGGVNPPGPGNSYTITATANPSAGGSVSGAGTYNRFATCTLVATANNGYTFTNWTKNGNVVSTNATYSFQVTGNATYVANFTLNSYTVTATANPTEGGGIIGIGTYNHGTTVNLTAVANQDYTFINWTENGEEVTTEPTYTFVITSNRDLVANFEESNPIPTEGAYLVIEDYTPEAAPVNQETNMSLSLKNVGVDPTIGITTVTLTCEDNRFNIIDGVAEFDVLPADETITLQDAFSFVIMEGVEDNAHFQIDVEMTCGTETWMGSVNVTANEAVLTYQGMEWEGGFVSGDTITLTAKFKNTGHYQATNAVVTMTSSSNYITIHNSPINVDTIAVGEEVSCQFNVTIDANCPESEVIPVSFAMTADGGLMAQGDETLKNSCMLYFNLADSFGDGWNGSSLTVSFDDGTESQALTVPSGNNSASYEIEVGNGTHVTLTWTKGNYDNECSFTVSYEGNLLIYQMAQNSNPSAGVLYEFDCNCAAASQTFMVNVSSSNTDYGTVSGGGEFSYGESCTVIATPTDGYMFTSWTQNGEVVSGSAEYTFTVTSDMDLVANFSEGIMIGDGGTTTNENLPSHSYYNYTLSEQIYTSTELGGAGIITSIAFYNGGSDKTRTYDFYLKNTTKSSFSGSRDWIAVSASDKVFSGSVTMHAGAWTVVTFDTPFTYDGTSNVVLVTDDNTGSYSSGMACSVFSASNQALYVRSDNSNYNPGNPSSYSGTLLSVKNQLLVTKEAIPTYPVFITVSINPAQAGTVSGGGEYVFGETCTVVATPNEGYTFTGWTENGNTVSTDLEFSFTATSDRDFVANFIHAVEIGEYTSTSNYLPSYSYYKQALTQQIYTAAEIGTAGTINSIAFYNEGAERTRTYDFYLKPTEKASFSSNTDWITVAESDLVFSGSVTMTANGWTFITFNTPFEYDGTSNLVLVADDNSGSYDNSPHMSCSVFSAGSSQAIYVYSDGINYNPMSPPTSYGYSEYSATLSEKNHILIDIETSVPQVQQTVELTQGWNWWSTYIELSDIDGLTMLEESLGESALTIKSQDAIAEYSSLANAWTGGLYLIENESGYKIKVAEDCTSVMSGAIAVPENHPITLVQGWNWIGYPISVAQSVSVALSDFGPVTGDVLKGQNAYTTYDENVGWMPSDFVLNPGESYMYYSGATEENTLVYEQGRGEAPKNAPKEYYWKTDRRAYADNLSMLATVYVSGEEQRDNYLELGAFVNGECRGSVKLYHVEPLDRYIAFLTVTGQDGEQVEFRLVDQNKAMMGTSSDCITFHGNAIVGSFDSPFPIHFGALNSLTELTRNMSVYPNPVDRNMPFMLAIPEEEIVTDVLVVNALGEVVTHELGSLMHYTMQGISTSGVYMLKVTCKSGNVYQGRVVVK